MVRWMFLLLLALPSASPARAADQSVVSADDDSGATLLKTVLVTGRQPGPGLWQVSKDGHVLWLLLTVS